MNDDGWLVVSGRRDEAGHGSVKPNEAAIPEGSEAEGVPATGLWIFEALCHSIENKEYAVGPIPPVQQNVGFEDAVDLEEGSGDSDEVNVIPTQTGGSSEKRKKNTIGPSLTGKGKKVKVGGAAYMQKQLNRLCDAVESYTTTTLSDSSKKNYETYLDTTEECMEMLLTLPGVEDGNELFMLGTRLFAKREYRNMFRSIKSVNSKLAWLQQELERDKIRFEMERKRFGGRRYY
ncbi:hypothetical protein SLEP1_g43788 [Rubroshorea leprosula]|uniref:Uncharacterized protein n=1 Tax=Rubroshorea leprosula TaxID=152421 RepID=A0AAV5LFS0_9ROSI|nr:hypothetical protein SLEP1_g43788 [Rubroshorea leprosula]